MSIIIPKIVYVDMDNTLVNFTKRFNECREKNPGIEFPQSQYGFFLDLELMSYATTAMEALLKSPYYDPYILTAPSILNPLCYTEKRMSVEKNFGMEYVNRLIINPHKHLMTGDIIIDDCATGRGQDKFEGELILFGSEEFPDWLSILIKLGLL